TIPGSNIGEALDAYHNHKKEGVKFAQGNVQAAERLHQALLTYLNKLRKIKGVASAFVDEVETYTTNSIENRQFFHHCGQDSEELVRLARRFKEAAHRLPREGATLEQIHQFHDGNTAQELGAVADRDFHGFELSPIQKTHLKNLKIG